MTGVAAWAAELDHEQVEIFRDEETGLRGVVAIHSTALGPAMGGLRLHAYGGWDAAVLDAIRLARAMTLKNAAAGLDLGGGKAVLIDDGGWADREPRMHAFGRVLERLGGRYITAVDVGTTPADMAAIAAVTPWVAAKPRDRGGRGDPSADTARTVLGAIRAALDPQPLSGASVAVLGVGSVGGRLAALLRAAGARVTVADVDAARVERVAAEHGCAVAGVADFLDQDVDVLAPCALGGLIGPEDADRLRCRIVAGAANNPLRDGAADALHAAGVLYVPDFLANCGGIIHVAGEYARDHDATVEARIAASIERTAAILRAASADGRTPVDHALALAGDRLATARA